MARKRDAGSPSTGSGITVLDRYQLLVESVRDYAIYSMDPEGYVSSWNAGAERLKGWDAKEIIGRHFSTFYPPEEVESGKPGRELATAAAEGASRDEGWRIRKDGSRFWAETVITAMRDESGRLIGFAKVTRDRTEQKRAEDALRRQQTLLTEANKSLDAFVSAVAHDLRAPIRHIMGFTRMLADDYAPKLDAEGRRRLKKIEDGAQNMSRLVDDLLNLARLGRQTIAPEPVALGALAREVIDETARETDGRSVEWRIGELFDVPCDPGLMRQVFVNLISNALKYTRPRESALIEVGSITTEKGERAVFVRDNGVGFDMRFVGKLFGVFQRLHSERDFEGSGVGLATVDRIVRKHGGRIWASAEVGNGATFFFTLAAPPPAAAGERR